MAFGLFDHAFAGIDQNDREVCGRSTRHHIAGVLNVAGGIGDDELAFWRGEIAIGDIDGDALFAFGLEAIGKQCQVHIFIAAFARRFLDGFELVLEDRFGIIKKASDESRFAVIDGTGGGET